MVPFGGKIICGLLWGVAGRSPVLERRRVWGYAGDWEQGQLSVGCAFRNSVLADVSVLAERNIGEMVSNDMGLVYRSKVGFGGA